MDEFDPLIPLLRRYQDERRAFDEATEAGHTDENWDQLAEETWYATQSEIIEGKVPATTAAGALLALDHVLQSDDLFADRSESQDLQMLWQLIKAARDFIASAPHSAVPPEK